MKSKWTVPAHDTWLIEYLALLGSLVSLGAIVILLATYDGHPVFDWHGVTLNAIVAVLSVANKGWLLAAVCEGIGQWKWVLFSRQHKLADFNVVDSASRGPFGSLEALWKRIGGFGLGLGTAIVLLSVAVDPFVQNLIQLETKTQYDNSTFVHAPVATRYSRGSQYRHCASSTGIKWEIGNYSDRFLTYSSSDLDIQSAFLYGLSNPPQLAKQQLQVSCPSRNCQFEETRSLGICSSCVDVQHMVEKRMKEMSRPQWKLFEDDMYETSNANLTSFWLPNGHQMDNYDDEAPGLRMTSKMAANASSTISFKGSDLLIWSSTFMNVTEGSKLWRNATIQATECALFFCINSHRLSIVNGSIVEEVSPVPEARRSPASWMPYYDELEDAKNARKYFQPTDSLQYDEQNSSIPRSDLMIGDGFNVSQAAVNGLSAYLSDMSKAKSTSYYVVGATIDGYMANITVLDASRDSKGGYTDLQRYKNMVKYNPGAMQQFYERPNLEETFSSIAISMTNALRAGADEAGGTMTGKLGTDVTFYRIAWPWIALPAVLTLLAFLFLWYVGRQTRMAQVPIWKSSSLAVLSRGSRVQEYIKGVPASSTLERVADTTYVRLLDRGGRQPDSDSESLQGKPSMSSGGGSEGQVSRSLQYTPESRDRSSDRLSLEVTEDLSALIGPEQAPYNSVGQLAPRLSFEISEGEELLPVRFINASQRMGKTA